MFPRMPSAPGEATTKHLAEIGSSSWPFLGYVRGMPPFAELAAALDKKRISIDRCFLSTIVNGDPKSQKLGAAIDAAHAGGRIICPIHLDESMVESSFLREATR